MSDSAETWIEFRARIFKALADKTRLKILYFLRDGERCQCEIIPYVGLAQPTVHRHLKVLADSGIVRSRKDGNRKLYEIVDPEIFKVLESVDIRLVRTLSNRLMRMVAPFQKG